MLASAVSVFTAGDNLWRLLTGLGVAMQIALLAVFFSLLLGIPLGVVMTSRRRVLFLAARLYLDAWRIVPVLVWLFIFYFELGRILGIHIDAWLVSVLVFSLWGAAEMSDIVRGAITSLPAGQVESGRALGLSNWQLQRYVIMPQVVRRLTPAAVNLVTRLIKTTSLVVLIGVVEVLKVGQQIIENSERNVPSASFWVYGLIFILYFIVCYPISRLSRYLERRWVG
ncbi:MAG: amino acid ABC transporter permease [Planctomycetota bacterium]|jgi:polar amino acid transport system permease protein|nr:amino acid ABC transporter permease [Planctomycetota bacterium]